MKITERIVMLVLALILAGGGVWFYVAVQTQQAMVRDSVARGEHELRPTSDSEELEDSHADWRRIYPVVVPILINDAAVQASVADTLAARIQGLSGTPYLPEHVVKLFVFGAAGEHSIWMKDMNYPIDILWVAKEGEIVHIEENVAPETYPEDFSSPVPAWYVIEANAGFVASNTIAIGDTVTLPR